MRLRHFMWQTCTPSNDLNTTPVWTASSLEIVELCLTGWRRSVPHLLCAAFSIRHPVTPGWLAQSVLSCTVNISSFRFGLVCDGL